MKPENGGIYTRNMKITQAGDFKFVPTVTDYFGNKVINDDISIIAVKQSELMIKLGGQTKSLCRIN